MHGHRLSQPATDVLVAAHDMLELDAQRVPVTAAVTPAGCHHDLRRSTSQTTGTREFALGLPRLSRTRRRVPAARIDTDGGRPRRAIRRTAPWRCAPCRAALAHLTWMGTRCHRIEICSRRRRRSSASSEGVRRGSSNASSSRYTRRSATMSVRRRASVGCAVNTGAIESRPINSLSSAAPSRRPRDSPDDGVNGLRHCSAVRRSRRRELAHALLLLGQVGQLEVKAERADQKLGLRHAELAQLGRQVLTRGFAAAPPNRDRLKSHALNQVECRFSFLFHDHLPEKSAEQLDLARKRIPRAERTHAARFCARCRVARSALR